MSASNISDSDAFSAASAAWHSGADLRARRRRFKRYTYGRQWDDLLQLPGGKVITEGRLFESKGRPPLTNNLIRQLVKCVIGNFRVSVSGDNPDDPAENIAPIPPGIAQRNSLLELDCRALEEFLISGCAIQRVVHERRIAGSGVWIDNVSPSDFFVNRFTDPRGLDIDLIGMLHSLSFDEVMMRFGTSPALRRTITGAYADVTAPSIPSFSQFSLGAETESSFSRAPAGRCRIIEVWTLEPRRFLRCHDPEDASLFLANAVDAAKIQQINASRLADARSPIDARPLPSMRWHCRFFTPSGQLLASFDSPYRHCLHPFAVKFFPLTDGEVHSFVEDIIDQQRQVNRLTTMMDHIIATSAKGILLFPVDIKPDSISWKDIADLWAQCDGIIPYDPGRSAREPKQMYGRGGDVGAAQLLTLQLQLMQQITGISDAMLGRPSSPGSSAALFNSQVQTSSVAILDMIQSFHSFRADRNRIVVGI